MRAFGVQVVQSWMDAGNAAQRDRLIKELSEHARSPSVASREGSYTALKEITNILTPRESRTVLALLLERFGKSPPAEDTASVALLACPLLNQYSYTETRVALRNIIAIRGATGQALESYRTLLTMLKTVRDPKTCWAMVGDLKQIRLDGELRRNLDRLLSDTQGECK
jgi:hypothetical protein